MSSHLKRLRRPIVYNDADMADKENVDPGRLPSASGAGSRLLATIPEKPIVRAQRLTRPLRSLSNQINLRPNLVVSQEVKHVSIVDLPLDNLKSSSSSRVLKVIIPPNLNEDESTKPKMVITALADKFDKAQAEPRKKIVFSQDDKENDGPSKQLPLSDKQVEFLKNVKNHIGLRHFHSADDMLRQAIRVDWPLWSELRQLYERTRRQALMTRSGIQNVMVSVSEDELTRLVTSPKSLIEIEMLLRGKRPLEDDASQPERPQAIPRHKSSPQLTNFIPKRQKIEAPTTPLSSKQESISAMVKRKLSNIRRTIATKGPPPALSGIHAKKKSLTLLRANSVPGRMTDDVCQAMRSLKISEPGPDGESNKEAVKKRIFFFNLPHGSK